MTTTTTTRRLSSTDRWTGLVVATLWFMAGPAVFGWVVTAIVAAIGALVCAVRLQRR